MTEIEKSNLPSNDELAEELEVLLIEAEHARKTSGGEMSWLPNWFLDKLAEFEAARARLKANYELLCNGVDQMEKGLWWKWGEDFMVQVNHDIQEQAGKKKSKRYLHGTAGKRTIGGRETVIIDDEQKAIAAATLFCPEAVKTTLLATALKAYAAAAGESLAGTHIEKTEKVETFYPKSPLTALPGEDEQPKLEGESHASGEEK